MFGSFGLIIIINKNYFSKLILVVLMIVSTIFFINQTNNCQLKNNDFYIKNQNYELNQKSMHMNFDIQVSTYQVKINFHNYLIVKIIIMIITF